MCKIFYVSVISLLCILCPISFSYALEPGSLLFRTTSDGKMYGYSEKSLLEVSHGILTGINPGHVGIYIGEENGEHFVVEALAGGVVKTPARYFINNNLNEEFLGAKIPKQAQMVDRIKAVKLAKSLVGLNLGYDFDFHKQKGPGSGDWTCVGLTEKIYESVSQSNPHDWTNLEYVPANYGIDITPDGFDNQSFINEDGDCLSTTLEFSKISRREDLLLPLPEKIGYNAGLEHKGDRYIFFPYTQFVQETLRDTAVDIEIADSFDSASIRGKTPALKMLLRWSLINNPISTVKNLAQKVVAVFEKMTNAVFGQKVDNQLVISDISNQDFNQVGSNEDNSDSTISINQVSNHSEDKDVGLAFESDTDTNLNQINSAINVRSVQNDIESKKQLTVDNRVVATTTSKEDASDKSFKNIQTASYNSYNLKPESLVKISNSPVVANSPMPTAVSNTLTDKNVSYKLETSSLSKIVAGLPPLITGGSTSTNIVSSINNAPPMAIITKIYATDNNDFIELYNPSDHDFDLAEASFRLEKSKTAEDPSLMMRIGNASDGRYPGGTIIRAKSYYLIVRDDASAYYLNRADAIATRSEFSWTSSAYIIYLGKGAISSSTDEDIVDAVGYGEAKYFQGTKPAQAISDNYFLERISNNHDNFLDFKLSAISDPSVSWEDVNGTNDNNNNTNNPNTNTEEDNQAADDVSGNEIDNGNWLSDFTPYISRDTYQMPDKVYFKNFSECYGNHTYSVGRFDCGLELSYRYQNWVQELTNTVDTNQFSLGFFYRDSRHLPDMARLLISLKNNSGQAINIQLDPTMLQIEGLPNSAWRYTDANLMPDIYWHHFLVTVNKEDKYWAVYIDGQEKYRHSFIQTLASDISKLELMGDLGSVGIDEFAIWGKSLSITEISQYIAAQAPLAPALVRLPQRPAEIKYLWEFNEGHTLANQGGGVVAIDKINNLSIDLPANSWIWRGVNNTGIINSWGKDMVINLPSALSSQDLSFSFWWRSQFHPLEGRSLLILKRGDSHSLGIAPSHSRTRYYYNDNEGVFLEGDNVGLTYDEKWHHFVVTYDSYRYLLKLYIDGEEKKELSYFWIKDTKLPSTLLIQSELNSVELDDLAIWEGALTPRQIQKIFTDSKVAD